MLHGRVVHPKTLGSTLVSAGKIDKTKYPNSQVVVKQNLVGVVAPTEWEAIQAAQQVAGDTKWTEWKGLPGSAKLHECLRNESDWKSTPVMKSGATKGDTAAALASALRRSFPHLPDAIHETRADWADDGGWRREGGRHGAHPHA